MTPEEILAECPELRYGQGLFWLAGKQHVYVNGEVATAWAQARKEARELRSVIEDINSKIGIADKGLDVLIKERDELKEQNAIRIQKLTNLLEAMYEDILEQEAIEQILSVVKGDAIAEPVESLISDGKH